MHGDVENWNIYDKDLTETQTQSKIHWGKQSLENLNKDVVLENLDRDIGLKEWDRDVELQELDRDVWLEKLDEDVGL